MPDALVEQLKSPGRMFIPVGTLSQAILLVDKDEHGRVTTKELFDVMVRPATNTVLSNLTRFRWIHQYVPLTDRKKQYGSD